MRLNVPTNADGSPIVSHVHNVPVQRDDVGYFIPHIHPDRFVGLLRGTNGIAWKAGNPTWGKQK